MGAPFRAAVACASSWYIKGGRKFGCVGCAGRVLRVIALRMSQGGVGGATPYITPRAPSRVVWRGVFLADALPSKGGKSGGTLLKEAAPNLASAHFS